MAVLAASLRTTMLGRRDAAGLWKFETVRFTVMRTWAVLGHDESVLDAVVSALPRKVFPRYSLSLPGRYFRVPNTGRAGVRSGPIWSSNHKTGCSSPCVGSSWILSLHPRLPLLGFSFTLYILGSLAIKNLGGLLQHFAEANAKTLSFSLFTDGLVWWSFKFTLK